MQDYPSFYYFPPPVTSLQAPLHDPLHIFDVDF
jgi:hypothetical protein